MERSCTHQWSRSEITELVLARMYNIFYKIIHFVMIIITIFNMPLQHKWQMLTYMQAKVIGKKVI